jgi:hypothetical protein
MTGRLGLLRAIVIIAGSRRDAYPLLLEAAGDASARHPFAGRDLTSAHSTLIVHG